MLAVPPRTPPRPPQAPPRLAVAPPRPPQAPPRLAVPPRAPRPPASVRLLHLDFETYSEANLPKVGAFLYSQHSSTEVLIACYAFDDSTQVGTWLPREHGEDRQSSWLRNYIESGGLVAAHNAEFEYVIIKYVLGWNVSPYQMVCTAARAAYCGLPRKLEGVAVAADLPHKKDVLGGKRMKMFCMPRKPTKKDARVRILPEEAPEEFAEFVRYCQQDVRTEQAVEQFLPPLDDYEQNVFCFNIEMNERGVPFDLPMTRKAKLVLGALTGVLNRKVAALTGGLRPTQRDKVMAFLNEKLEEDEVLENLQADSLKKRLAADDFDGLVKEIIELRMEGSKASIKKLVSILTATAPDGRARGMFLYYGASTGRYGGRLIQPHNFIRGLLKPDQIDEVFALMQHADWRRFRDAFDWPISQIAQCMRGFIRAQQGNRFLVVDYSSIEARVLVWLAGQTDVLQTFIDGLDPYIVMASKLYKVPYDEVTDEQRRIGKSLVLGCGFGLGWNKFVEYSEKAGTIISPEFSKIAVKAYRDENPKVVQYWEDVNQCAIAVVRDRLDRDHRITLRQVSFYMHEYWLVIELPSGRELRYFKPRVKLVEKWGKPMMELSFMSDFHGHMYPESTYGGKTTENIVQAVARDIMVHGMFMAEDEGYNVIGTIHDEGITENPIDFGSIEHLEQVVCRAPPWAAGLPVRAKGFAATRYRKG